MSIFDLAYQAQSPSMGGTGGIGALNDNQAYPLSRMDKTQYAVSRQLPASAEVISTDYDPKTDVFTGMPNARFAKGGDVDGNVDVSFDYANSAYMDPSYGYAHDPVYNGILKASSEGVLSRYKGKEGGDLSPQEEEELRIRAMVASANQKYDPRYMPLRLDDRPLSPIQAAMLRLQADKQIGEGNVRAGISGLAAALPDRQGVTVMPGAYDVGYNTPVGPGNLDISAYRAMKGMPSGRVPQGVNARYSIPFAKGGIATLHYDNGGEIDPIARMEEISRPEAWNPESGQVKLQTLADPQDPYGGMKNIDYTIPKDQIKNYAPSIDQATGLPTGGGAYALNDGSTMHIGRDGIVQAATPARNEYTLNKDGYYQPTGAGLTWNGGLNQLTKKIGGVDVVVDPMFTKGGYQDAKGNLSVDENGVPIPLAPNYLDSGVGKSGLSDAAPYITAAMLAAATMGASLPESAAMIGGEAAASTAGGITALDAGTQAAINAAAAPTYTSATLPAGITSVAPTVSSTMLPGAAALPAGGTGIVGGTAGALSTNKLLAASLASKALSGGSGSGSAGPTTTTTQAPPQPSISNSTYNPAFTMPNMFATNNAQMGNAYQPQTYRYYAQGGVADLGGYAAGGSGGSYSDGGQLLKGPGDGVSDSIPATIAGKQPARLADGEFIIPSRIVSEIGNGSTDAGARKLYQMMDRIQHNRKKSMGKKKFAVDTKADKFLLK